MSKIIIGKFDDKNFVLPRDTVTSTLVILGGKGMGKTNLGGVVVEEVNAQGDRWCVIDPLGVWWGLRHSLDGKGPGIECVILGGPHGDIPIEPTGGAVAADLVVDEQANVIIDISRKPNGEMWGMGERIRFAKDFAKRLFQRQGELVNGQRREPIFVELDEAATFIPQTLPSGNFDIAECISAWQTLVEWGRNVGIGVGLLTQRSARINKSVTEVADALFAFRIVGPNSIKAVTDWLGEHVPKEKVREHIETIRSLDRGRCLVVSPGWMKFEGVVDIRLRHTFDSSATPKPGERQKRVTGKAAKPDLTKYQERMKETIDRAKAEDPKELRKQVQELKGKLAVAEKRLAPKPADPVVSQASVDRAVKIATSPLVRQIETLRKQAKQAAESFGRAFAQLNAIANLPAQEIPKVSAAPTTATIPATRPAAAKPIALKSAPPIDYEPSANGLPRLGDLHFKMAAILAAHYPEPVKKELLASMCGKTLGGGWNGRLSEARQHGLLEDVGPSLLRATEKCAQEFSGRWERPTTTEEAIAVWSHKLSDTHRAMLNRLIEADGEPVSKAELAEAAGKSLGGGFNGRLSELRSTGLMLDAGRGFFKANKEALFLPDHAA